MDNYDSIGPDQATRLFNEDDSPSLGGGRYRILEAIGQGGMGTTCVALDTQLQRKVAIKQLHVQYGADPIFRQRFYREAKAMARLNHENIIQIFDFSDSEDALYLVMEYFPERDLEKWMREGTQFSMQDVLEIARMVGSALACAHEGGVYHRDVKPANILYSPSRGCKLTDFGIAGAEGDQTLTRAGDIMGSPKYMSPEQAAGRKLDGRSDLFSLGVMLFELATGQEPYSPNTTNAIASVLIFDTSEIKLNFPQDTPTSIIKLIESVVKRAPEDRLQDANTFCELVDETFAAPDIDLGTKIRMRYIGNPTTARMRNRSANKRLIKAAIGATLAAGLAGIAWWQLSSSWTDSLDPDPIVAASPPEPIRPNQDNNNRLKNATNQIRRSVVTVVSEARVARRMAVDTANRIFPESHWAQLQEDYAATMTQLESADTLYNEGEYSTAQDSYEQVLKSVPPLMDRWIALRKEAEDAIEQQRIAAEKQHQADLALKKKQREEAEQRRLDKLKADKARQDAARKARHNQLTADDRNEVQQRLTYVQQAFQNRDLLAIQRLSKLSDQQAQFFQKLFSIYRQISANLDVKEIDTNQAVAEITITSLVNLDGNTVVPSASWRSQSIRVPRVDAKWQMPSWQ